MQQTETTDDLVKALQAREIDLTKQMKLNDYHREFYMAKKRHLQSQLALTQRQLDDLGFGQQSIPITHDGETSVATTTTEATQ